VKPKRYSLFAIIVFIMVGVIIWGGFNTAMEATNTMEFCISCHDMEATVYQEYKHSVHYSNPRIVMYPGNGHRKSFARFRLPMNSFTG